MEPAIVTIQISVRLDYWFEQPSDVLVQVEAAASDGQTIQHSHITITPCEYVARVPAQDDIGTRTWLRIQGRMEVEYQATLTIDRQETDWAKLAAVPLHFLPGDAVQYLLPSRYCQSDQFTDFVKQQFGGFEGGAKIAAMCDWIAGHLSYVPGSSDGTTTAVETFHGAEGICRDYAHLMVTFARAAEIPARVASVYAPGVTPPDFHAVAEVFVGGAWHFVDATGMASASDIVRIGVGRDIGDVAFLTAYGPLVMNAQTVSVETVAAEG